jgi:hypothetical protein
MAKQPAGHEFLFRVPRDLWAALKAEADRENRSANAQLVTILQQRYPRPPKSRQKKAAS